MVTLPFASCSSAVDRRGENERNCQERNQTNGSQPLSPLAYVHLPARAGMPSFKDRFRSSRKSKKGKESGADDATTTSGALLTVTDHHTGSATTHSSHHPVDHSECSLRPVSRAHDCDRYRLSETNALRALPLSYYSHTHTIISIRFLSLFIAKRMQHVYSPLDNDIMVIGSRVIACRSSDSAMSQ